MPAPVSKGKKRKAAPADLPALAESLVAEPRQKANNLPVLLAGLTPECAQAVPVLHSLRLFFIDAFDRGDLSVKPTPPEDASPEAVLGAWLHRQYSAYQAALLRLLGSAEAGPRTQVAAFVALMECVRGERPGVFNNRLFHRLLRVLLCAEGAAPEVLGLLISKFLGLADVRYFTLCSMAKIAQQAKQAQQGGRPQQAGRPGRGAVPAPRPRDESSDDEEEAEDGVAEAAGQQGAADWGMEGGQVGMDDLARTLHDMLAGIPPEPPGMGPLGSLAGAKKRRGGEDGEEGMDGSSSDEEQEEEEEQGDAGLRSWCGAAEVGLVTAANAGEGSRQRKRQRRLLGVGEAAGVGEGQQTEQQRAKWANGKAQQRVYSDAWLALLRLELPEDILKKVLARTHDLIIPSLARPLLLADFLTATLDRGGMLGMLALNGIFLLVTQHRLEYPNFYARLYQLLTPEAFQARHRSRFFALADVFLASGMVPAYTAAAFAKRLARLALTAPPAGALLALAFIHNIVRRHPATMQLLHRPPRGGLVGVAAAGAAAAAGVAAPPQPLLPPPPQLAGQQQAGDGAAANGVTAANGTGAAAGGQPAGQQQQGGQQGAAWRGEDVYDFSEPDPAKSRALESSLWELEALRAHYNPQVSAYCAILEKDLRDRKKTSEVDISELLAASYASMFAAEAGRRLKQVPTAFYRSPPAALFGDGGSGADWAGWAV